MIIVMPDANTGKKGYFNDINNEWRYEDFFFDELMPYVESTYRIKNEKQFRAISGLSMGGGGSFMYAMHHPELFSAACPLSAYIGPLNTNEMKKRLDQDNLKYNEKDVQGYYEKHNALSLIENIPVKEISSVRWYIDCGDDDFLFEGNSLVHIAMRKKEIPHEYRVRDGSHGWSYWREALPEILEFVSSGFHRN